MKSLFGEERIQQTPLETGWRKQLEKDPFSVTIEDKTEHFKIVTDEVDEGNKKAEHLKRIITNGIQSLKKFNTFENH